MDYFLVLHFLTKIKKMAQVKKLSERATACLFHLPLPAFVAVIMKLKARAVIIFVIARNLMMGTPGKSDKIAIQYKYFF